MEPTLPKFVRDFLLNVADLKIERQVGGLLVGYRTGIGM
jgi:hypothetical protein